MVPSPKSFASSLLTGVAVAVLTLPVVVGVSSLTPLPLWTAPVIVAVIAVLVAVAVVVRNRDTDSDADGETVWDTIPDWQYDGRHVESGGLARDEQERALRDVHEQTGDESGRNGA